MNGSVTIGRRPTGDRLPFIDATRGLYLCWMIAAHALLQADVPEDHWAQLLRPHGWATLGFVMLTGFSIALVFGSPSGPRHGSTGRLHRRAFEIGLVALLSNYFFSAARALSAHELSTGAAVDILTLRAPWTISAILVPTVIILLLAPLLLWVLARLGAARFLLAASVLNASVVFTAKYVVEPAYLWEPMPAWLSACFSYQDSYLGFPIVTLTAYAIWAFGLGSLSHLVPVERLLRPVGLASAAVLISAHWVHPPNVMLVMARFGVVMGTLAWTQTVELLRPLMNLLRLLGRSSLFIFVAHRLITHGGRTMLSHRLHPGALALVLCFGTISACVVLCELREFYPPLHLRLRAVGL